MPNSVGTVPILRLRFASSVVNHLLLVNRDSPQRTILSLDLFHETPHYFFPLDFFILHFALFLSRWPVHPASAENMKVDMIDRLAAFRIAVGYYPESPFSDPLIFCYFIGNRYQVADQAAVLLPDIHNRRDMLFRDHQRMNRRLRVYIFEGKGMLILIDYSRRYFFVDDLTEYAIAHKPSGKQL